MSETGSKIFGRKGSDRRLLVIIAATIIFAGFLVIGFWVKSLVWPLPEKGPQLYGAVKCPDSLRSIAGHVIGWSAEKSGGKLYPPSLKSLLDDGLVPDPRVFLCPAINFPLKLKPGSFATNYDSVLDMLGFSIPVVDVPVDIPLAWDTEESNHSDGRYVVWFDRRVEFLKNQEFDKLMPKITEWVEAMRAKYPPGHRPAITTVPAAASTTPPASSMPHQPG